MRHCGATDNPSDSIKTSALQTKAQTEEIITQASTHPDAHTDTSFLNSKKPLTMDHILKYVCFREVKTHCRDNREVVEKNGIKPI